MALAVELAMREAERRVEEFIERFEPRWLYVMWSGGKDSTASLLVTLSAARALGVRLAVIHTIVPGQTHPDNTRLVLEVWRRVCRGCPVRYAAGRDASMISVRMRVWDARGDTLYVTAVVPSGRDFWALVEKWGLPAASSRMSGRPRWCMAEFKLNLWKRLPPNTRVDGKMARALVVGVRRGESWYRARRWPGGTPVTTYEVNGVVDIALSPLYDASSELVWSILRRHGVDELVARVYERWGRAPNCALCPLKGVSELRRAAEKLPTQYLVRAYEAIRAGMTRWKQTTMVYKRSVALLRVIGDVLRQRGVRVEDDDGAGVVTLDAFLAKNKNV